MVSIISVKKNSLADKAGLLPDDILISVNGNNVADVLDYRFYMTDTAVRLTVHRGADIFDAVIEKDEYEDIGLEFETYLMDKKHTCRNNCIFCFIDQMPKGCRETLYFKDDDDRLSFLQGNYITTTNLTDGQINRIIKMHLSPINISVHATEPELRVFMMKNKNAGKVLGIMKRFADAGITQNAQIVLCRNINDGEHLIRSMTDLFSLFPSVRSVSVVPCGLTAHREGLYKIEPFDKQTACDVISRVEAFADKCRVKCGSRIFFCADEFYLLAGRKTHAEDYYEGFPQFENGVGTVTSFRADAARAIKTVKADLSGVSIDVITGQAAKPVICEAMGKLSRKTGLEINVHDVKNDFFGGGVNVAGLVVGRDIINQLKGKITGKFAVIPSVMLRAEGDLFLDGTSVEQLQEALGVPVLVTPTDAEGTIEQIIKRLG